MLSDEQLSGEVVAAANQKLQGLFVDYMSVVQAR